jgi:hypothetical protein
MMENMNKELTVPKWVLIVWPKIPQIPQNLSVQVVCPSPRVLDFNEKRLHWASIVRFEVNGKIAYRLKLVRCSYVHTRQLTQYIP